MKDIKGRFLSKLKLISAVNTLKQGLVFKTNPTEKSPPQNLQTPEALQEHHQGKDVLAGNTGISDNVKDLKDEVSEWDIVEFHKKDITAPIRSIDMEVPGSQEVQLEDIIGTPEVDEDIKEYKFLSGFEEKCPPGGEDSVIFYTTSLRGIRKTFENCSSIRFLLQSFKIRFQERDVSMHLEYREELWKILGGKVIPPKLFIRGRFIGGADEVVALHEQGKLQRLFEGMPRNAHSKLCSECANLRFAICPNCNGSCKVIEDEENDEIFGRCLECNENGLIKCPLCC